MELRPQCALDPGASLVVRPELIAKRLDHMVGRDAEVGVAVFVLDYLENGLQHANDRAVGPVFAFGESAQSVEVTEEFVSAVEEVHDHIGQPHIPPDFSSRNSLSRRSLCEGGC